MCLNVPDLERRRLAHGEVYGFEYEVVVNHMGYRCGYIRVLPGHPWYENSDPEANVHGGFTFADYGTACATHVPEAEWWLGFDCAHGFDAPDPALLDKLTPEEQTHFKYVLDSQRRIRAMGPDGYDLPFPAVTIRSQAYVMSQIEGLVAQALAAAQ